jgi:hypothetical protein
LLQRHHHVCPKSNGSLRIVILICTGGTFSISSIQGGRSPNMPSQQEMKARTKMLHALEMHEVVSLPLPHGPPSWWMLNKASVVFAIRDVKLLDTTRFL